MSRRLQNVLGHLSATPPASSSSSCSSSGSSSSSSTSSEQATFENVLLTRDGRVATITLNRPKQLNALSGALIADLGNAIHFLHRPEQNCGAIIITGAGRAFAAGADIKQMVGSSYFVASTQDSLEAWAKISDSRIPLIAAVNGLALGGGCEISMMCDIIYASENAQFGQPEIKIGTIPGAGGTQRLTHAIGKSKAMELVLTGRSITAAEAERAGLVSAVLPLDKLLPHAMSTAQAIASLSKPIVVLAKEAVNAAFETTLHQGMRMERRLFHSTFALSDRAEGMRAFAEKRPAKFQHA